MQIEITRKQIEALRQDPPQLFRQPSQRLQVSSSKRPTPTFLENYICPPTSLRAMWTDSSSTLPNVDLDCGLELQPMGAPPRQSLEPEEKMKHSSLRHGRVKDNSSRGSSENREITIPSATATRCFLQ